MTEWSQKVFVKCYGTCTCLLYNFSTILLRFKVFIICLIDIDMIYELLSGLALTGLYGIPARRVCHALWLFGSTIDVILTLNLTFVTIPFTFELKFDPISCYILLFFASYFLKVKKQNKLCSICHKVVGSQPHSLYPDIWYYTAVVPPICTCIYIYFHY